ncbi:MAG TPA: cyclic nucleotide-binding domain-containing protein [Sorangium sp.]|uniref:cyclic nucleotide-binding domain-containing protein n=1 Tax=Sorangium sp. So ce1153 TaxID=3133333 RepID=UPI002CA393EF|nr:cyclic nucleotide-binding domain-containing protein [Sorangium sp.]
MRQNPELVVQLREIGLFGGLGDHVLQGLADTLELLELQPGAVAFREGDSGREMFVLLAGEMEVLKRSKRDVEARVAVLGPSDWFGEMSILDVMPRSATVRAISPSRLMRVTAHDLDALYRRDLKSYTLLVLNIAREMSRRLRVADSLLAELVANMLDEYTRPRRPGI